MKIDFNKLRHQNFCLFSFIFLMLILAYYPVINGYYLHTDDYFWSKWGVGTPEERLRFLTIVGRPLAGLYYNTYIWADKLADMNFFRFISILNLSLGAFFVFLWLRTFQVAVLVALTLSVTVFTLPPFQVFAAYLATAPYGISSTVSALALLIFNKINPNNTLKFNVLAGTSVVGLLVISLALYQPGAGFYLALLPMLVLLPEGFDPVKIMKAYFRAGLFFGIAVIIYYLSWRIWLSMDDLPSLGRYDAREFVTDWSERLTWFFDQPLKNSINLWNIRPNDTLFYLLLILLVFNIFYNLRSKIFSQDKVNNNKFAKTNYKKSTQTKKLNTKNSEKFQTLNEFIINNRLGIIGISGFGILLFIPLSYLISLVSSNPAPEYRTFCAIACIIFLLITLPLMTAKKNLRLAKIVSGLLMIGGIISANHTVNNYFVIPDSSEVHFLLDQIGSQITNTGNSADNINIIIRQEPVAQFQSSEIGEPSGRHGPNIKPIIRMILNELGITRPLQIFFSGTKNAPVWVKYNDVFVNGLGLSSEGVRPLPNSIIVDMNMLPQMQ